MTHHPSRASRQSGVMLIEALLAILIFSIGVLGIIGMQGVAAKVSTDAKYRSEAALLANNLIGRMWTSDRTQSTFQTVFASPNGTAYKQWAWEGVITAAPGTAAAPALGTVLDTLKPPAGGPVNAPTVAIASSAGTAIPSSVVTITIFWQVPGSTVVNQYVTVAQIGG